MPSLQPGMAQDKVCLKSLELNICFQLKYVPRTVSNWKFNCGKIYRWNEFLNINCLTTMMSPPSHQNSSHFSSDDFAAFLSSKVRFELWLPAIHRLWSRHTASGDAVSALSLLASTRLPGCWLRHPLNLVGWIHCLIVSVRRAFGGFRSSTESVFTTRPRSQEIYLTHRRQPNFPRLKNCALKAEYEYSNS